jgi:hypothetical protein
MATERANGSDEPMTGEEIVEAHRALLEDGDRNGWERLLRQLRAGVLVMEPAADGLMIRRPVTADELLARLLGGPELGRRELGGYIMAQHVLQIVRIIRAREPDMTTDELEGFLLLSVGHAAQACRDVGVEPPTAWG